VPWEAVVQWALRERVSVIREGVRLYLGLLRRPDIGQDATVAMLMLAILEPEELRARLAGRVSEAPRREEYAHLGPLDRVWRVQSFLLSEAGRAGIPIVVHDDKEKATNQVLTTVIDLPGGHFDRSPQQVSAARAA
jgi:2-phosphoglycerate kinase